MSNRETFPASLFPLQGDLSAEAGATKVTVIGLQTVPILNIVPTDNEVLRYSGANSDWEPSPDACTMVLINDLPASDDPLVYVNGVFILINAAQVLP